MKMDRAERRRRTENKVKQREQLMSDLGMQQGTVYKRHREKIQESSGYMRDGNVSHFVACGYGTKTKNKNKRYGSKYNYSHHDAMQLVDDYDEDEEKYRRYEEPLIENDGWL